MRHCPHLPAAALCWARAALHPHGFVPKGFREAVSAELKMVVCLLGSQRKNFTINLTNWKEYIIVFCNNINITSYLFASGTVQLIYTQLTHFQIIMAKTA